MKLIIQVPAYNEAEILPTTIRELPERLEGIDAIEYLVIDDGSHDDTARVAGEAGVHHIVKITRHSGLAAAFAVGLDACLKNGADLIVNTDADNQYNAQDIQSLIDPILAGKADIVVGDRDVASNPDFSTTKRWLQRLGSWIITRVSGVETPDAASGFRAFSREAAFRTLVMNEYTYTLETLIQAGAYQMAIDYVPVRTNPQTRPSRLVRSIPHYLLQSMQTIIRSYTMYKPLRVFSIISALLILGGLFLGIRYLYYFAIGEGSGHVQSVILAAVLTIVGFQTMLIGLLADLIGFNRLILQDLLYRLKRFEYSSNELHTKQEDRSEPIDGA